MVSCSFDVYRNTENDRFPYFFIFLLARRTQSSFAGQHPCEDATSLSSCIATRSHNSLRCSSFTTSARHVQSQPTLCAEFSEREKFAGRAWPGGKQLPPLTMTQTHSQIPGPTDVSAGVMTPHKKESVESVRLAQQAKKTLAALYKNSAQSHVT